MAVKSEDESIAHINWQCPNYICQDIPAKLVVETFNQEIFK
jgi:hypothetical protein